MINVMRTKFGPKIIGGIIAVIAGVFVISGVFLPGSGSQAPSVAGEVNGEIVSYGEFSRALNQRIEFMKNMMGGKVSEETLAQFKIREAVFQDLAQKKLMAQIAKKEGFYPSAEQIREAILKMPVFNKEGRFDPMLYKNVLSQNQYTPTRFEELIGADLMEQNFRNYVSGIARVTPSDIERSLQESKNRRKLKYVYVDSETLRKTGSSTNLDQLAADLEKKMLPLVTSGNSAQVAQLLKDKKAKIQTSDWLSSQNDMIQGVGSLRSVQSEVFAMKKGEPAKAFRILGGTLYATVADLESYDAAKVTEKERSETSSRLQSMKQNEIYNDLLKSWMKKAKITRNDRVVVGNGGFNVPVTAEQ
jgi:hypothetical protein